MAGVISHVLGLAIPLLGLLTLGLHMAGVGVLHALRTYSRSRLERLCEARGHPRRAEAVARHGDPTERAAEALSTLAGLGFAALLGAAVESSTLGPYVEWMILGAVGLMAVGHVTAAVVGRVHAERVLDRFWPLAGLLRLAMAPVTTLHGAIERLAYRSSSGGQNAPRPASVEVEIPQPEGEDPAELLPELPAGTRQMLQRLVALTRMDVDRLMVPASQIQMLPESIGGPAAARAFADSGYSRVPLYGESRDDIVGVLYAKDLLARLVEVSDPASIVPRELARKAISVPETKNAAALLDEMRSGSTQIAMVVNEFGVLVGMVSLEDLLEAFVGPIQDEHDKPPPPERVVTLGGSEYDVDASLPIDELNERLGLRLPTDQDYTTLGGLVLTKVGHLPQTGETIQHEGVELTVLSVQGRAIRRLLVRICPRTRDPAAPVSGP